MRCQDDPRKWNVIFVPIGEEKGGDQYFSTENAGPKNKYEKTMREL